MGVVINEVPHVKTNHLKKVGFKALEAGKLQSIHVNAGKNLNKLLTVVIGKKHFSLVLSSFRYD